MKTSSKTDRNGCYGNQTTQPSWQFSQYAFTARYVSERPLISRSRFSLNPQFIITANTLQLSTFLKTIKLTKHNTSKLVVRVKISFVFTAQAVNTSLKHCYNLQTWWHIQYDRNIWRWQVTSYRCSEENLRGNILIALYIFTLKNIIIIN